MRRDKDEYYKIIQDIKRIDLLKKAGFLADKITIEKAVSVVLHVIINLIGDYFQKLNDKYNVSSEEYYLFIEEFKNQVNTVLQESNFNDLGIVSNVEDKKKIRRYRGSNKK